MNKLLNITTIITLSIILLLLLGPRIERAYLHWHIIMHTKGMAKAQSDWADIYYTERDAEYIPLILRLTDFYLPLILNDFNVQSPKRAVIVVYSDAGRFNHAVGKPGTLPMGVYFGGVINIISPSLWMANANDSSAKDYFIQHGPLIHELAHFAADLRAYKNIKPWLSEGMALYYEYKYTGVEWRPDLKNKAAEISVTELTDNFRRLNEHVAYRKAFDIVRAFVRKYGEDRLQQLLAN